MPAIRLAYLVDSMEVGGSELNAIRTLEYLDRSRFELSVIHMGGEGFLTPRYLALEVPRAQLAFKSFKHPSMVGAGLRLIQALRRSRVQILHTHDVYSNIFGVPWARLAGIPVVIASKRWQYAVPSRVHLVANQVAMRRATAVLANSEVVAQSLREADGVAADRIHVVPNFVEADAFDPYPSADRAALLARLQIPPDAVVAGVVARLSAVKDQATALHAMARLSSRYPRVHLLLIGDGPDRPLLEALTTELGLGQRVHFPGRLPNRPNLHGLLDISVLSSVSEGFPNAVIEAMAAGRPVVATDVGGVRDAVIHQETGILVPPGNPAALADGLELLLRDPGMGRSLGERGRERARQLYYVDPVLDRLMGWYSSLLQGSSHG